MLPPYQIWLFKSIDRPHHQGRRRIIGTPHNSHSHTLHHLPTRNNPPLRPLDPRILHNERCRWRYSHRYSNTSYTRVSDRPVDFETAGSTSPSPEVQGGGSLLRVDNRRERSSGRGSLYAPEAMASRPRDAIDQPSYPSIQEEMPSQPGQTLFSVAPHVPVGPRHLRSEIGHIGGDGGGYESTTMSRVSFVHSPSALLVRAVDSHAVVLKRESDHRAIRTKVSTFAHKAPRTPPLFHRSLRTIYGVSGRALL